MCLSIKPNYKPEKLKKPVTVYKNYEVSDLGYVSPYKQNPIRLRIGSAIVSDRVDTVLSASEMSYSFVGRGFHCYLSKRAAKKHRFHGDDITVVFEGKPEHFVAKGKFCSKNCAVFTKLTIKDVIYYKKGSKPI